MEGKETMVKKHKGIKRNEALYPLSHHHTNALFIALKLKQAGTKKSRLSLEEVKKDAVSFFEPGGKKHFREEEEVLLTAYAQYASIDRSEIQEMLLEHVKIRAKFDTLNKSDTIDVSFMHDLGNLLESHIRKEERIIFPMIEKAVPEEKLRELASHFHENK